MWRILKYKWKRICYLLRGDSIRSFCGKCLSVFLPGGKDVLYDFFKREDIKWRQISLAVAKSVYVRHNLGGDECALVVDDTIKKRSGKKVDGVSTYFEHSEGRCVKGQQVVELGLSTVKGFVPLDRRIFIGEKNVHPLNTEFQDKRCAAARDYSLALSQTKHEMLEDMLRRVQHGGGSQGLFHAMGNRGVFQGGEAAHGISERANGKLRLPLRLGELDGDSIPAPVRFHVEGKEKSGYQ